MKEFVISEAKVETAILVGLITQTQDERKTTEYLDELEFLAHTAGVKVSTGMTSSVGTETLFVNRLQKAETAMLQQRQLYLLLIQIGHGPSLKLKQIITLKLNKVKVIKEKGGCVKIASTSFLGTDYTD